MGAVYLLLFLFTPYWPLAGVQSTLQLTIGSLNQQHSALSDRAEVSPSSFFLLECTPS